jgi:sRNA-binding protein
MALAGGTMRIDLDGEPAGTVTEIERQYAIEQLDARFPWWRKRAWGDDFRLSLAVEAKQGQSTLATQRTDPNASARRHPPPCARQ